MNVQPNSFLEVVLFRVAHASVQAAILVVIVLAVRVVLRQWLPARWRCWLWLVVFVRLALPATPSAPWSAFRLLPATGKEAAAQPVPSAAIHPIRAEPMQTTPTSEQAPGTEVADAPTQAVGASPTPQKAAAPVQISGVHAPSLLQWLALIWLAGAAALVARLAWLRFRLAALRRTWAFPADPTLGALFDSCRRASAVRRVKLRLVSVPIGAASLGVLRPTILLSKDLVQQLAAEELRLVLLHELQHVRRHDVLIDRVAALLTCVHWFNPVAWLALAKLRQDREMACDEAVLAQVTSEQSSRYGQILLRVASTLGRSNPLPGTLSVFGGNRALRRRIEAIAQFRSHGRARGALALVVLLLVALCGLTDAANSRPGVTDRAGAAKRPSEPPSATSLSDAASSTIDGVCFGEDGQPLTGVKATLYRLPFGDVRLEQLAQQTTGVDGRFAFDNVVPIPRQDDRMGWMYAVTLTRAGTASCIYRIYNNEHPVHPKIPLTKAAALSGRVTDANGKPVAGADVFTDCLGREPLEGVHSARTDAKGRFTIPDLSAWDTARIKPTRQADSTYGMVTGCYLTVRHPAFAEERPFYRRIPDFIEVVLHEGGLIEGRVIDQVTGKQAAGTIVSLQSTLASHGTIWQQARTDADGKYRLTSLPSGTYNVWADAPDRSCEALDSLAVTAGKTTPPPDLKLLEGGWIEGNIIDVETRAPISRDPASGRRLAVANYGPARPKSGAGCQVCDVDDHGNFRLHVAPGKNFPYIMYPDVWQRTQRVEYYRSGIEVKNGEVARLTFRVLAKKPPPDPDPAPFRVRVPVPAERQGAALVRDLGGWYQLDKEGHVVEVNMVYYQAPGIRRNNERTDTDAALRAVSAFPRLQKLYLKGGQASDEGLASLAGLEDLRDLGIWDAHSVTDAGVKHLAKLKHLRGFFIGNAQLGDASLRVLGEFSDLEFVSLEGNAFTDEGLRYLAPLKRLRTLWLNQNRGRITDAGVRYLAGLTTLQRLDLPLVSDEGIAALKDLKELRQLFVTGSLDSDSPAITDRSVDTLLQFTHLTKLWLRKTRITKEGVRRLINLPALDWLDVSSRAIDPAVREELGRLRPKLQLEIQKCD